LLFFAFVVLFSVAAAAAPPPPRPRRGEAVPAGAADVPFLLGLPWRRSSEWREKEKRVSLEVFDGNRKEKFEKKTVAALNDVQCALPLPPLPRIHPTSLTLSSTTTTVTEASEATAGFGRLSSSSSGFFCEGSFVAIAIEASTSMVMGAAAPCPPPPSPPPPPAWPPPLVGALFQSCLSVWAAISW
jgi:hypothetical protein